MIDFEIKKLYILFKEGFSSVIEGPLRNPILGNILITCVIKGHWIDFEIGKNYSMFKGFSSVIKGPLRNPKLGNILIALYKEI